GICASYPRFRSSQDQSALMPAWPKPRRSLEFGSDGVRSDRRSGRGTRGSAATAGASTLRQPRLAPPVKTVLEVLGVPVDPNTFVSFNGETGVDSQHLRGFGLRLLKSSQLRIGRRQIKMGYLQIGRARCVFAGQARRFSIAIEQVIRQTHLT